MSNLLNLRVKSPDASALNISTVRHPSVPEVLNPSVFKNFPVGALFSPNETSTGSVNSNESDVVAITGFFLDLDLHDWILSLNGLSINTPEGKLLKASIKSMDAEDLVPYLDVLLPMGLEAIGAAIPFEPTYVMYTGAGFHIGFWYDEPLVNTGDNRKAHKLYLGAVIDYLNTQHVHALSGEVGVISDTSCKDIIRRERVLGQKKTGSPSSAPATLLYWNPDGMKLSHPDAEFVAKVKATAEAAKASAAAAAKAAKQKAPKGSQPMPPVNAPTAPPPSSSDDSGKFHGDWYSLDVVKLLTRAGHIVTPDDAGQLNVECPFREQRHPNTSGNAVVRLGDEKKKVWADIYCHHAACKGKNADGSNRHLLSEAIEAGIFSLADAQRLSNPLPRVRSDYKRGKPLDSGSEYAIANAFLANMSYAVDNNLAYFGEDFYCYNEDIKRWVRLPETHVFNDIGKYFDKTAYIAGVNAQGNPSIKYWTANHNPINNVHEQLKMQCRALPIAAKLAIPEPGLMFTNGFLRPTGEFINDESTAKDAGCTVAQSVDYAYDPDASAHDIEKEAPKFCAYIKSVLNADDMNHPDIQTLLEYPGLCLLGMGTATEKVLLLYGKSGCGKSTYIDIVRAMFDPSAVCVIEPNKMSGRFQLTELIGRRVNIVDDLSEKAMYDASKFKSIATGGLISAEFKNQSRHVNFSSIAGSIIGTNHHLRSTTTDEAVVARIHQIDFLNQYRDTAKQKPGLSKEILRTEHEAITRHCIYAALRAVATRRGKLRLQVDDHGKKEVMLAESSDVWRFLIEACTTEPEDQTSTVDLFNKYLIYCANENIPKAREVTMTSFGRTLVEFGEGRGIKDFKFRKSGPMMCRAACDIQLRANPRA